MNVFNNPVLYPIVIKALSIYCSITCIINIIIIYHNVLAATYISNMTTKVKCPEMK